MPYGMPTFGDSSNAMAPASAGRAVSTNNADEFSSARLALHTAWGKMVGVRGFEPPTPASRRRCSTRLSYTPMVGSVGAVDGEFSQSVQGLFVA